MIGRSGEEVFLFSMNEMKTEMFVSWGDFDVVHSSRKLSRRIVKQGRMRTETYVAGLTKLHSRGNPSRKLLPARKLRFSGIRTDG